MRDRLPLLAGLGLLALAVGLGSYFIAGGIRDRNRDDVITVTGSAKKRIVSDTIVWDLSLRSDDVDPAAALTQLNRWTKQVRAYLRTQGVRPGELTIQPISTLLPGSTDDSGQTIAFFRLTRDFEIDSTRVRRIAAIAEHSSSLLAVGVPLESDPLQYVFTKLPKLRPELVAAALRDAQVRARAVAGATGAKIGGLRGVDVGVFQVTSPNSTNVSDYGEYDTTTLPKDVTAVVNATFALR
ncbi:MAG TPA: SIMPL domain-containing protein [Gaiellaceae bacterium]|nr:SIMPL domain-containing protein [Gaiellaceae bacterium]